MRPPLARLEPARLVALVYLLIIGTCHRRLSTTHTPASAILLPFNDRLHFTPCTFISISTNGADISGISFNTQAGVINQIIMLMLHLVQIFILFGTETRGGELPFGTLMSGLV